MQVSEMEEPLEKFEPGLERPRVEFDNRQNSHCGSDHYHWACVTRLAKNGSAHQYNGLEESQRQNAVFFLPAPKCA